MSKPHFQIAIIGSGFAGSLLAMMAQRLGFSTVLIERGSHPRFAIGESSTPVANLLLEEISVTYDLPFVRPLCKWGSWQKQLPHLGCGLKRGFTFYHHEFGKTFSTNAARENQLLVGASPNEEIADTHWYRPDFDQYLMLQAQKLGVTYLDETLLDTAREDTNGMSLTGTRHGESIEITAEFVIDATGPRGFLHRALGLPEKSPAHFPPTQGLFSHFENVGALPDNFFPAGQTPPYPPEHAAVHHVFPGGWIWVLKFNNGLTSSGVAATEAVANELNFKEGEPAWQRLLQKLPSVAKIFQPARATIPFFHPPRISFQSGVVTGSRWALLPSAAGFIDPLLSTGFPLTLLGVQRLGEILKLGWKDSAFQKRLDDYATQTTLELETAARLVGALYANMNRFEVFKELSLLYFIAASFSETARRLGKPELANGFLLCCHPVFAKQFVKICAAANGNFSADGLKEFSKNIRAAIEPLDVAGLTDDSRHPWYPAVAADLLRHAGKVGATETEMRAMLVRCGL
jgi:tetracycline 7-halogenase / FADH2 O2-dependent halogenase